MDFGIPMSQRDCPARRRRLLAALPLLLISPASFAQYQWRDGNGRMVFSDQPPPHDIDPAKVIRRDPGRLTPPASSSAGSAPKPEAGSASSSANAKSGPTASAPESFADRQLDAKRKAQEKAEAERKKKEQAEQEAKVARACEDMRTEVRTLETGMRVTRVNAQGEREFLSDEDRTKRIDSVRRDMREHCKQG